jgi:hypothetical protein
MPEENKKPNLETLSLLATCLGFNELAKQGKNLGQKVYYRLMRNTIQKRLLELGVEVKYTKQKVVLTLDSYGPLIEFSDDDIELMRIAVREHDDREEFANSFIAR